MMARQRTLFTRSKIRSMEEDPILFVPRRAALASGSVFRLIHLSLIVCAAARRSAKTQYGESKSFRIYRLVVSIYEDSYIPSSRRIDNPREINQAERSGRMRGAARPKISRDFEP